MVIFSFEFQQTLFTDVLVAVNNASANCHFFLFFIESYNQQWPLKIKRTTAVKVNKK